jgi:hypothetical protein
VSPDAALRARPIHHLGYVVDDLERVATHLAQTVGAGPFLHIGHVMLSGATFEGAPAQYDHSTAFGQWGPMILELSQVHTAQPDGLRAFFGFPEAGGSPAIGHVAWLVDDLEAESAELESCGLPLVHTGTSGPVSAHWHDGGVLFGHPVEVLRRCPEILGFYAAVAAVSVGWDGEQPLRDAPGPPSS